MNWSALGFQQQKKHFERVIQGGSFAHAYLFSGPDMIGKKKFAQDLYQLANVRESINDTDPDIISLASKREEDEHTISIDDARKVKTFLSFKPYVGPYKFVIIDDAERLTTEASNALLKVLEEPTPFSVLILVSSRPKLLLPTIASRCQEVRFLPHTAQAFETFLKAKKLPAAERDLITMLAGGRIGWALKLIEEKRIGDVQKIVDDLQKIGRQGIADRLAYAKTICEKENYAEIVEYWMRWIHTRLATSPKAAPVLKNLIALNHLISQPQYNHKLAIENFLVNL